MVKRFQAKHIADAAVLRVLKLLGAANARRFNSPHMDGASRWDVADSLRPVPWKVVNAKLSSLKRRGLVDGCAGCTCGGLFKLTEAGAKALEDDARKEKAE